MTFTSWLLGEIPADDADAHRTAGTAVYAAMNQAAADLDQILSDERRASDVKPAEMVAVLSAWMAFVAQLLGDSILGADYQFDPSTTGHLPEESLDQALAFYAGVDEWLRLLAKSSADSSYVSEGLILPAHLPAWTIEEPREQHAHALQLAINGTEGQLGLRPRAEHMIGAVARRIGFDSGQVGWLNRQLAEADSIASRAEAILSHPTPISNELRQEIVEQFWEAIQLYAYIGQVAAMPLLIPLLEQGSLSGMIVAPASGLRLPGDADFSNWCITDPLIRGRLMCDPAAILAISSFWERDGAPGVTIARHGLIVDAINRGRVGYAMNEGPPSTFIEAEGRVGHHTAVPWGPVYQAIQNVRIGGVSIRRGQRFVYDAYSEGRGHTRTILVGKFGGDTAIDYRGLNCTFF